MVVSTKNNHTDWVYKVRSSPSLKNKFYATVGWDGRLKIWTDYMNIQSSIKAHDGPINALSINPNGLYIATGGKDQTVKIWKVTDLIEPVKVFKCDSSVTDIAFNPEFQWVAACSEKSLRIWDLSGGIDS